MPKDRATFLDVSSEDGEPNLEGTAKLLTKIKPGRDGVEGMLQFQFVDVDGHIGPDEVLQPTAMVEVQVTNDHRLYVLDAMPCLGNGLVKIVLFRVVVDLGKDIVDRCLR